MSLSEKVLELESPITYQDTQKGDCEATFISMKAPSVSHLAYIAPIRQAFSTALVHVQQQNLKVDENEKDDEDEDQEMSPASVMMMIESSPVKMEKVIDDFKKLILKTKLFQLDGEQKFTEGLLEKLSVDDFYNLMGTYLVNFIIASLLKKMNKE